MPKTISTISYWIVRHFFSALCYKWLTWTFLLAPISNTKYIHTSVHAQSSTIAIETLSQSKSRKENYLRSGIIRVLLTFDWFSVWHWWMDAWLPFMKDKRIQKLVSTYVVRREHTKPKILVVGNRKKNECTHP